MRELIIRTRQREEFIDITDRIHSAVRESGVTAGIVLIQSPHTTLAVTANENADPDVVRDALAHLATMVPRSSAFRHRECNSDSHIKVSIVGPSLALVVEQGRMQLGTWQGIFACEFDGPRERRLWVQVVGQ